MGCITLDLGEESFEVSMGAGFQDAFPTGLWGYASMFYFKSTSRNCPGCQRIEIEVKEGHKGGIDDPNILVIKYKMNPRKIRHLIQYTRGAFWPGRNHKYFKNVNHTWNVNLLSSLI